jgi:hypothetical protein
MAGIILIAAVGILAVGVAVGIIALVNHGIRREQRRFEKARRLRENMASGVRPTHRSTSSQKPRGGLVGPLSA